MSAGTLAPPSSTSSTSPKTRGARRRTGKYTGGNPLVYALALAVVALTVGPVLYGVLGGFRTNAQLAVHVAAIIAQAASTAFPPSIHTARACRSS